jgi:tRNA A37 N6-isopentenylltransferase MiaA
VIVRLKQGARVKTDAATIFAAVEASKEDGNISLERLVEQAKPKDAPLHKEFTWNDSKAAEKWRLNEARYLVKAIEVVHENSQPTRAWEAVTIAVEEGADTPPQVKRVFRSVQEIMDDPAQRDELLVQALRDAAAWRKRYAGLQELALVHAAIDETVLNVKAA